jgi:hypothetical protein
MISVDINIISLAMIFMHIMYVKITQMDFLLKNNITTMYYIRMMNVIII